ncbi:MAG: Ig-like domain repeat protein [Terriglobales bacterium]
MLVPRIPIGIFRGVGHALLSLWLFALLANAQSQTRRVDVGNPINAFTDAVSATSTSTINVGDKIQWVWVTGFHTTTSANCTQNACTANGLWNGSVDPDNLIFERVFATAGTFSYFCEVHGFTMKGTVIVQATAAAATTTVVTSSGSPSAVGANVTFTATVTSGGGTPAGNVTFKNGGVDMGAPVALNGSGVATFSTSALAAGTHTITASYAGNASFAASNSAGISQVAKINTTTGLQSSANPSTAAQNVTFTATVTNSGAAATGSISFRDNGVEIGTGTLNGSGAATFQTSALTQGTHPLTAVYAGGDSHFGSTSSTLNQVVNAPLPPVNFQPAALNFGGVVLLRPSAPQTLTLTNETGAPISTSSLQTTGDYTQTNNCGQLLDAQANCTISVTLTPQGTGTIAGQVTLVGANTVSLTGTGVEFGLSLTRPQRPPRH